MNKVRRKSNNLNQQIDFELISRIREGDPEAKEKLVNKYIPMVKHIIRNYYASFFDFEDLLQEGVIGLLNAIEEYKPEEYDVKFSSFAYICIIRKVYNVIKQTSGNKHRALNEALSLHAYVNADENRTILDIIVMDDWFTPEKIIEEKIITQQLNQMLSNHLSLLEYSVITMLLRGYSCREIESKIGVEPKAVDNARTRVKAKLRKIISEYGSLLSPNVPVSVRKRKDLYIKLDVLCKAKRQIKIMFVL
ncbi:MAG: sigma-70 family RNA polymerase sigma factor [Firmicutes bacterium]|nr:sigma-70 family RNA polymerase sigma factor [Bacillota bacterium]